MLQIAKFDKYDLRGAYHWEECDEQSSVFNPPLKARYELVWKELQRMPDKGRILDVGCGDAYLLAHLAEAYQEVFGIDPEPIAIDLANKILASSCNCNVMIGECYNLPFNDQAIDVVVLTDVIEHLTEPKQCLSEIRRVLSDDGYLVLTTPQYRVDRKWDVRHVKEFAPDELGGLLKTAFSEVTLTFFGPLKWFNFYNTRLGWKFCKYFARFVRNPFLQAHSLQPERYGQMMAVCSGLPNRA